MASRKSTCKGCNEKYPSDEMKVYSGKKYCQSCYNKKIQEQEEYKSLIETIKSYYDVDIPNGYLLKQIKTYKEEFNYTYAGMNYTLFYCKEIKNLKFDVKYGLGIVKYEYENAKQYFLHQQKIANSVKNMKHEEKIKRVKVNIKKQQNKSFLLNIDELIKDGDS